MRGKQQTGRAVFMCGFRPFFLLGTLYAILLMAVWGGFLLYGRPLPAFPRGPVVWHGQEMIFGFVGAALAGFILTAAPGFTGTRPLQGRLLGGLVILWIGARLGAAGWLPGGWWTATFDLGLLVALACGTAGPLLRDKRHRSLWYGLAGLCGLATGYYLTPLTGGDPMKWLRAVVGWYMILIVLSMSRISMRIVNRALEGQGKPRDYLARPPRRNLAVLCFFIHLAAEFRFGPTAVTGWCALAAGSAMLNLLADWHLGRILLHRRVLMLYLVYWNLAAAYLVMGVAILFEIPGGWLSAGRHLAMIGGMALAVFGVFVIAGRAHAGLEADERRWVRIAFALLCGAALARVWYAGTGSRLFLVVATGGWIGTFLLYLVHYWRILVSPREDGEWGC